MISPDEALRYNQLMTEKLSKFMARQIKERMESTGADIMLVCSAGEELARCAHFSNPSIGCVIKLLNEADSERWWWFVAVTCGDLRRKLNGKINSDLLKIISGRSREEWFEYQEKTCRHPEYVC